MKKQKISVIGMGGNSILRANEKRTIEEQYSNLWETVGQLVGLIAGENRIVI